MNAPIVYARLMVKGSAEESVKCFFDLMEPGHFTKVPKGKISLRGMSGYYVIVLQGGMTTLDQVLRRLPEAPLARLQAEAASLVIDHSREGVSSDAEDFRRWHNALKKLEIPAKRVCYVTQNRVLEAAYQAWCAEQGISDRIGFVIYDYYIKNFVVRSWGVTPEARKTFLRRVEGFEKRQDFEKDFVCLNYKPRPWRIALLAQLIRDGYWDEGIISFGGLGGELEHVNERVAMWKKGGPLALFQELPIAEELMPFVEKLGQKGQIFISNESEQDRGAAYGRVFDVQADIFHRSGYSLVTETGMSPLRKRITEKPMKALANFHPLVMFGDYKALELVRELGFKTFDRWIDESYDAIEDPETRFRQAYSAFVEFRKGARELVLHDKEMRQVLVHNAEMAMVELRKTYRKVFDLNALRAVTETIGPLKAN